MINALPPLIQSCAARSRAVFHSLFATRHSPFAILDRRETAPRRAFTLIEMIIVISIISALLALLYGALERAQKFSRRTITYSELKTIETALKQYKAHYHAWPTNELADVQLFSGNDRGFVIDERTARLLQGNRADGVTDSQLAGFNPEMIPFLELSRYSPATRAPVNPFKPSNPANPGTTRAYKVLFDTDGDRQIVIPAGADPDAPSFSGTNIIADMAVWTVIPGTRQVDSSGQPQNVGDVIFGSWQSFGAQ
jgi:prepilin-type N-terminal cleavage/methylation domain-containing protein